MPRTKGTPNKLTKDLKQRIVDLLESELDNIDKVLKNLSDKDRVTFILGLMSYVVSKPKTVQQLTLDTLTESQTDEIINQLLDEGK